MTTELAFASRNYTDTRAQKVCPQCKTTSADRIPRGLFVKLFLFWRPIKKYKCRKCRTEYYIWR